MKEYKWTKAKINKALRLLRETREVWKQKYYSEAIASWRKRYGDHCPLCFNYKRGHCFANCPCNLLMGTPCGRIIRKADVTHSRRPVYRAIDRMIKKLEAMK